MTVTLTDVDARTLYGLLHDYLPALKREAARTDPGELRHILYQRQTLCERLVEELRGGDLD